MMLDQIKSKKMPKTKNKTLINCNQCRFKSEFDSIEIILEKKIITMCTYKLD